MKDSSSSDDEPVPLEELDLDALQAQLGTLIHLQWLFFFQRCWGGLLRAEAIEIEKNKQEKQRKQKVDKKFKELMSMNRAYDPARVTPQSLTFSCTYGHRRPAMIKSPIRTPDALSITGGVSPFPSRWSLGGAPRQVRWTPPPRGIRPNQLVAMENADKLSLKESSRGVYEDEVTVPPPTSIELLENEARRFQEERWEREASTSMSDISKELDSITNHVNTSSQTHPDVKESSSPSVSVPSLQVIVAEGSSHELPKRTPNPKVRETIEAEFGVGLSVELGLESLMKTKFGVEGGKAATLQRLVL